MQQNFNYLSAVLCSNPDAGDVTTHSKVYYAGSLAVAALDLLLIFLVGTHEDDANSLNGTGARG